MRLKVEWASSTSEPQIVTGHLKLKKWVNNGKSVPKPPRHRPHAPKLLRCLMFEVLVRVIKSNIKMGEKS